MKNFSKKPELLAPAGNLEKLKIAFRYGADAVYFGAEAFSLRAAAKNFSYDDIVEGVKIAHSLGKKLYCTVNVMPRNEELKKLPEFLEKLSEAGVDAVKLLAELLCHFTGQIIYHLIKLRARGFDIIYLPR